MILGVSPFHLDIDNWTRVWHFVEEAVSRLWAGEDDLGIFSKENVHNNLLSNRSIKIACEMGL